MPVNTTTGMSPQVPARPASVPAARSRSCPAACRSSTQQSNGCVAQHLQRLLAGADGHHLDVVVHQQLDDARALDVVVLDDQQPLRVRRDVRLDAVEGVLEILGASLGLTRYENAPCARPCWRSSSTDRICTGMCRVAGSSLRLLSTVQPSMSGRKMSSVMAVGRYWRASASAACPRFGDDALEALVARQPEQDARVVRIVLDDQQRSGRPPAIVVAVVGDDAPRRRRRRAPAARCVRRGVGRRQRAALHRAAGPGVVERQVERERAALARRRWPAGSRRRAGSPARG